MHRPERMMPMKGGTGLLVLAATLVLFLLCASWASAGMITEFSSGLSGTPDRITAGVDGSVWFTEFGDRVGRIAPDGEITEFSAGITSGSRPYGIVAGPDG